MRVSFVVTLALCVSLLAGCASAPGGESTAAPTSNPQERPSAQPATSPTSPPPSVGPEDPLLLRGRVVDPAINPIRGATVRLVGEERTATTDAQGAFSFDGVPRGLHVLQAIAPGYALSNTTATPESMLDVRIVLQPIRNQTAYQTVQHFKGIIECAFEALIISPSCDSALLFVPPEERPFNQNYTFLYGIDLGWRTQVLDIVFDGSGNPGLDGLRIALRGIRDEVDGGNYTQYGRWHGPESFTVRIEPGGNYTDGIGPVPGDYTGFRIDVYPHGHAYHTLCDPNPGGSCFLGAGAGLNVVFDLYVTTFYGQPAPEGYTLQD